MRIRNIVLLLAVLCLVGVEGPQAEQAVLATAQDLGTTNGFLSNLTLSDRGVIAGWGGSDETFVLDTRTGASVTLPYFEPQAVNSRGQVVGIYDAPISFGGVQGTTWSERDQLQRMPDFVPFAINQHGAMAGNCMLGPDVWGPACVAVTDRTGERTLQAIDVGPAAIGVTSVRHQRSWRSRRYRDLRDRRDSRVQMVGARRAPVAGASLVNPEQRGHGHQQSWSRCRPGVGPKHLCGDRVDLVW